ncbi:hypothetical protein AAFF_G00288860 [Aldrovandia affinis]|uniref:Uncharacterized protein n=1 Tax=Aldrovandia affinis TaxID=143900 RepID=A0AAD7SR31_9TELE|nr:hypothetical protein AAFF_G00288860 [Aldrovandia affinis]
MRVTRPKRGVSPSPPRPRLAGATMACGQGFRIPAVLCSLRGPAIACAVPRTSAHFGWSGGERSGASSRAAQLLRLKSRHTKRHFSLLSGAPGGRPSIIDQIGNRLRTGPEPEARAGGPTSHFIRGIVGGAGEALYPLPPPKKKMDSVMSSHTMEAWAEACLDSVALAGTFNSFIRSFIRKAARGGLRGSASRGKERRYQ